MIHFHSSAEKGRSHLRPSVFAVRLACASFVAGPLLAASSAHGQTAEEAKTSTTLPEVRVTTQADTPDPFITQGRRATVGKRQASIQDTPFSVSVVDTEQAKETGAVNIEQALTYTSGVYAGRYGFDTRGDWAAIRGLNASSYQDGLRWLYGSYNNVRPEIFTLERVEVLKGPSSVLYGQGDLGGIVNVASKLPKSTPSREVEVQIGSYDRKQVGLDMTGPLNQDGTLLYRLVTLARDSNTQVDYVNDDAFVLMPSLTYRPNADTSVTVLYTHQKNKSKVSSQFLPSVGTVTSAPLGTIPSNRFVGEPGWDRYDTEKDELSLFVDQRLNEFWKGKVNLRKTASSSITREIYADVSVNPDAAGNITRTVHMADRKTDVFAADFRLEGDVRLGPTRHQLAIGFDFQNSVWEEWNSASIAGGAGTINLYNPVYGLFNPATVVGAEAADNKIVQRGIYVMDHMEWGPWVVSGALRNDRTANTIMQGTNITTGTVHNSESTGQLGVMYRFANGISPYLSYSEAFVPNTGTDGTAGGRLKPTTGTQREGGVKYLSASGNTSVAFAAFNIKQENRISQGATPGGVTQIAATTEGWELEARHRMGRLELLGNYTKLDAINPSNMTRLSSVPEKSASAWAQYHFNGGWRAGFGARHIGNVTGAFDRPVAPSVNLYDAMVGYTIGKLDLRLNVRNINDKQYVSWCRGPATAVSAIERDCGYGNRRNIMLTANYKF